MDDFSRALWTFLLKDKGQVCGMLRNFILLIHNQFFGTIKVIQRDNGQDIHQIYKNNAYLHGYLIEEIYMRLPPGFTKGKASQVYKLNRSLYGFNQASRQWNHALSSNFQSYGFIQFGHDHYLFTKTDGNIFLALIVYVDDVIITGKSLNAIKALKSHLDAAFTIKDLGSVHCFLKVEISRSTVGIYLSQHKYILDLLIGTSLTRAKPNDLPLPSGTTFDSESGDLLFDPKRLCRLLGKLLYLNFTRPDVSYAIDTLSQFVGSPCTDHWEGNLHVIRYLKGTLHQGLHYSADSGPKLVAYCDTDWAKCKDA